jgi:hypothetical protein
LQPGDLGDDRWPRVVEWYALHPREPNPGAGDRTVAIRADGVPGIGDLTPDRRLVMMATDRITVGERGGNGTSDG